MAWSFCVSLGLLTDDFSVIGIYPDPFPQAEVSARVGVAI